METADFAIEKLVKVAKEHPRPDISPPDCIAFSRQVCVVEGMITSTYGVAIRHVRREPDLDLIVEIWQAVDALCDRALTVLSSLKAQFPNCGTPETHNRVLDLKSEVGARLQRVKTEIQCQHLIPDNIFD